MSHPPPRLAKAGGAGNSRADVALAGAGIVTGHALCGRYTGAGCVGRSPERQTAAQGCRAAALHFG
ncbi:hypothetical protein M8756_09355 [Lutimaribacter sp. EGI FJ00015]|nr:hypothetical protein [Lutimaribacter sp. EGI FJ00015]